MVPNTFSAALLSVSNGILEGAPWCWKRDRFLIVVSTDNVGMNVSACDTSVDVGMKFDSQLAAFIQSVETNPTHDPLLDPFMSQPISGVSPFSFVHHNRRSP